MDSEYGDTYFFPVALQVCSFLTKSSRSNRGRTVTTRCSKTTGKEAPPCVILTLSCSILNLGSTEETPVLTSLEWSVLGGFWGGDGTAWPLGPGLGLGTKHVPEQSFFS